MKNPAIRYVFAALLLLGSPYCLAGEWWYIHYLSAGAGAGLNINDISSPSSSVCDAYIAYSGGSTGGYTRISTTSSTTESCEAYVGNNQWQVRLRWKLTSGSCPSEISYDDPVSGQCLPADQEPVTCEAGTDPFQVRYTFAELDDPSFDGYVIQKDGCGYDSVGVDNCGLYADDVKACTYNYEQNGYTAGEQGGAPEPTPYTAGGIPQTSIDEDGGATTFVTDPPITNPDGSVTKTTQEITTNTTGSGAEIWNDDTNFYIRDSTGTVTVYDRAKTQTTNTDASIDETITVNRTTQTPSTSTTVINGSTGQVTSTGGTPSTTTNKTTVTNNTYDSDGTLTDSTSTTTGGSEVEGDENEEGNCGAPGQPPCEVTLRGEDKLTPPDTLFQDQALPVLDQAISEIESVGNDDITGDLLTFNPLNLYEGGTCNPLQFSVDYHSQTFAPLKSFCEYYDSDLRPMFAFLIYVLTAFGLYYIYVRTMRNT